MEVKVMEEQKSALELLDEAIRALAAEGYLFEKRKVYRVSYCSDQEHWLKQAIEVDCFKSFPEEDLPPDLQALEGFAVAAPGAKIPGPLYRRDAKRARKREGIPPRINQDDDEIVDFVTKEMAGTLGNIHPSLTADQEEV